MADNEKEVVEEEIEPKPSQDNIPLVTGDDHLKELVDNMPEVVPDAVEASNNKEAETEQVQKSTVDRKGRPFNPDLHLADGQGNPIFTPGGAFKKKFRIPGTGAAKPSALNIPETTSPDLKLKMAAAKLADVFLITGISFFGDEWKPEITKEFNERQMLIDANERWMLEYGYIEPPAWIDLLLAYGLYTGKRIMQRKPEGKISKMIEWTKMKATNFWLWLTGKKIRVASAEK